MSDLDEAQRKVAGWLQPMADDAGPCGPDLEYDNAFLALTQAAAGKPESQFGPAEPPDWRAVRELAEELLDRSRDLRVALLWAGATLRMDGFATLPAGLQLIDGLLDGHWDHVHPLPDPDDGDPYARVNALTTLTQYDGMLGSVRAARVMADRAVGELTGRSIELACALATPREGEPPVSRDQAEKMLAAAVANRG